MNRHAVAVAPQSRLRDVARVMQREGCSMVPVVDEGHRLLGVVREHDFCLRALSDDPPSGGTAADVMTREIRAVLPQEDARQVIAIMDHVASGVLPVVMPGNQLLGMISLADLARFAERIPELQAALQGIAARRSFWTRFFR